MKKISGKALSLVLSLALVVSSFSVSLASASTTHTVSGSLSDTSKDVVYAVSGETKDSDMVITDDLQSYIFDGGDATVETADHKVEDAKVSAVSHSSGDRLVKWYDAGETGYSASIDDDTTKVGLKLRSSSVSGHEVLNVLYKGTYTDDDGNDVAVKASKTFDVYVYAKDQPVVGDVSYVTIGAQATDADNNPIPGVYTTTPTNSDIAGRTKSVELSDAFAQKVMSNRTLQYQDSKNIAVFRAVPTPTGSNDVSPVITWQLLTTVNKGDNKTAQQTKDGYIYYTLKSSNDNIKLTTKTDGSVKADVKNASSGAVTLTAETTAYSEQSSVSGGLSTTKDVTLKTSIAKKIKVDVSTFTKLSKYSGNTYLCTSDTTLDDTTIKDSNVAVKATGFEINYTGDANYPSVSVDDKASVTKISGKVGSISVGSGSVGSIALADDAPADVSIQISDAKVGDVDFGSNGNSVAYTVTLDASDGSVGNVTDATAIEVSSGTAGNLTASDSIDIKADDDEAATVVGDVKTVSLTVDSEDSKVSIGTIKAKDAEASFELDGSNVSVKGIDFDYRDATLKFDGFQGSVPAPVNASEDGANISTTNADDRVEVVGDANIDGVSIEEDSQLTFDGKLNVTSIDGSGMLVVGAGKMYIDGSVSGAILKLSDPNFTVGTTAFTALTDTVDVDDFDTFGFTLSKTAGSNTDTFKIASIVFKGLAVNKSSSEIAKGYSETFTAGSYPAGLSIPAGYTIQWNLLNANDQVFSLTTNADGSATVKVIGYDTEFASENKATLQAQLVDENGDVNTDYTDGETALTALAVPATNYKSDTTGTVNMKVGGTYQFKITSLDGTVPNFVVAGNGGARVTGTSVSGKDYFYKVTAQKVGQYGVYVNGTIRTAILNITTNAKIDTTAVTIKLGNTYQFKVTSSVKPSFGLGSTSAITTSTSSSGTNYFYKVKAAGKVGDKVGVYVDGGLAAVITVG